MMVVYTWSAMWKELARTSSLSPVTLVDFAWGILAGRLDPCVDILTGRLDPCECMLGTWAGSSWVSNPCANRPCAWT